MAFTPMISVRPALMRVGLFLRPFLAEWIPVVVATVALRAAYGSKRLRKEAAWNVDRRALSVGDPDGSPRISPGSRNSTKHTRIRAPPQTDPQGPPVESTRQTSVTDGSVNTETNRMREPIDRDKVYTREEICVRYGYELDASDPDEKKNRNRFFKLKKFRGKVIECGLAPSSAASYLKHLRASLGWAEENGYIDQAPRVRAGSTNKMKGRPITGEEFERMLQVTPKVVGTKSSRGFKSIMEGMWVSGLRLSEAMAMTWDDPATIHPIRLDRRRPMIAYPDHEQKNNKDQLVPMTPEAVHFFRKFSKAKRTGLVFPLMGKRRPVTSPDRASRIISDIGKRAMILTRPGSPSAKERHATAHDLRRSYASRLLPKVPPAVLRELMRHADIKTTLAHYAELDAEQLAEEVWSALQ